MNWYQSKNGCMYRWTIILLLVLSTPGVLMPALAELFPFKSRPSSNQVSCMEGRQGSINPFRVQCQTSCCNWSDTDNCDCYYIQIFVNYNRIIRNNCIFYLIRKFMLEIYWSSLTTFPTYGIPYFTSSLIKWSRLMWVYYICMPWLIGLMN